MSIQTQLWKSHLWSKRWPIYLRLPIVLCTGLAVYVSVVVVVVHAENLPRIVEPPASLFPGNQLPESIPCTSAFERRFECKASQGGEVIHFTTANSSRLIMQTSITTHNQTLGKVSAAWGTPTGFTRSGHAVYIYWGIRWAYLFTCTVQPTSHIEFISYRLADFNLPGEQQLPWRGFTSDNCDNSGEIQPVP